MRRWPIREVLAACVLAAALVAACLAPSAALAVAPPSTDPRGDFDARAGDTAPVPPATADARDALAKDLGDQSTVSAEPTTGGIRDLGRTDGFLTGPSKDDPAAIALGYVRGHLDVYGLDEEDLATLDLTDRSTSADGITHLAWRQLDHGVPAYDSALTANVTRDGRLINTGGAPVHDLDAPSTTAPLGPAAARGVAQRDLGVPADGDPGTVGTDAAQNTTFADGDHASLVTVADPDRDRLAWRLTVAGPTPYVYDMVVDAASGAILARHSLTDFFSNDAQVHEVHPGDGTDHQTPSIGAWLTTPTTGSLTGPDVHAYPDRFYPDGIANDNDIARSASSDFIFPPVSKAPAAGQHCPTHFGADGNLCTWDGIGGMGSTGVPADTSSDDNLSQVTTQVFYYTNKYHDWLQQDPIDFDANSGAFDSATGTSGTPADPLKAETDDSANYGNSTDGTRVESFNNANMTTPPDGQSPTMQMYLFNAPNPAVNGGDDATVVYHEYTHGLTNRLIFNGAGLNARQSKAMGEGWSDWYALDFLTHEGQFADSQSRAGDEVIGAYVTDNTKTGIRNNAVDCKVSDPDVDHCPGTSTAGAGGFTLADLGRIDDYDATHSAFEVHSDGEIWAETLWDLRDAIGEYDARAVITEALRLSPKNPTFLDERDAILRADLALGTHHRAAIWQVFAHRGMGFSASTTSSNATHAAAATDVPPAASHGAPSAKFAQLEQDTPLTIPVTNPGPDPITNVHATLTAATDGVTVTQGSADLATIAGGGQASAAFNLRVGAGIPCGEVAATTLRVTADNGVDVSYPIQLPVGTGTSDQFTYSYPANTAIPEDPTTGLSVPLDVPTAGRVGAMRVTLAADHPWIGDLHVWLTSPAGTRVDLMERPGTDTARWYSGSDLASSSPVVFDDDATNKIQELPTNPTAKVSGAYKADEPLSAFAGENRAGTWTLHVVDAQGGDPGTMRSWSLQTGDPSCAITDAPTGLTDDSATFHARVDPGQVSGTTAAFELGKTATYGARSPASAVTTGGGLQDFTVTTGGLTAGTTYHVRAVTLRNGAIVAAGADQTFVAGRDTPPETPPDGGGGGGTGGGGGGTGSVTTTPGTSTASGGNGGTGGAGNGQVLKVPKATMKSLTRSLRLDAKGRYTLSFRATPGKAKGTFKALVGKSSAGSKVFTVPSSGSVKITIKATKKLLGALRSSKAHSAKAKATFRIGVTSFTATLTIKPYKKPATKKR